MGGSYNYPETPRVPVWETKIKEAMESCERRKIAAAYQTYAVTFDNVRGFIAAVAKQKRIEEMRSLPKEFSDLEYEIKFDITLQRSEERETQKVEDYFSVFDFPATSGARFLKDSLNTTSVGFNYYFGTADNESLVVIEKMGKIYLKEKSEFLPIECTAKLGSLVSKRKEQLRNASLEETIGRISEILFEQNVKYRGKLRKERGDFFILDVHDGRVYNCTISFADLTRSGEKNVSEVQRQFEIEYAGYVPGFSVFKKDSERQLIEGLASLAQYTFALYGDIPLKDDKRMLLTPTRERKYDFVANTLQRSMQNNSGLSIALKTFNSKLLQDSGTDITIEEVPNLNL